DGQRLFVGDTAGTINVWGGKKSLSLTGHPARVNAMAFSPDGKHLLSGGKDGTISLREAVTGRLVRTCKGPPDGVDRVLWDPKGKWFVTAGKDNLLRVWDATTGEPLRAVWAGAVG